MERNPKSSTADFALIGRAAGAAHDVAGVIQGLTTRSAKYAGPHKALERDSDALAEALDALRIQHEELLVADEELRAQLEELSRVDEIIALERARSQAVFAFAPDAYVITNLNGAVSECNLAALSLFGRDTDRLVRKPLAAMIARGDLTVLYGMAAAAAGGEKRESSLEVRQRGSSKGIRTKAVVTRMGKESLFWRFRLLDEPVEQVVETTEPAAMADVVRILVLSHDKDIVSLFDEASKRCNGVVEIADSIREGMELLKTFPADIVVADLWSDGNLKQDIISELRLIGHRPMPLGIAVSGVSSSDSAYALKAGFHSFLMKPVSLASAHGALQTLNRVLMKRSARRTRVEQA